MPDKLYAGLNADETNCAREPIHVPGKIQPHGVLLAWRDDHIEYASQNAERLHARIIGQSPREILGPAIFGKIQSLLRQGGEATHAGHRIGFHELAGKTYDLVFHRSGEHSVLELEELAHESNSSFTAIYQAVNEALHFVGRAGNVRDLWQSTAEACRQLSGYDRVMIYRFDPEWNGTVVAEAKATDLEPFLGLRYPASDIPAQARALYERNWIRAIPSVDYVAVPVVGPTKPLDLSLSTLRSVSPVHLQYLQNMGVGASMSVSIINEGRLWGLIAFHHRRARFLPFELRQGLEFLGKFLSLQIAAKEKLDRREERAFLAQKRLFLEGRMRNSPDFLQAISKEGDGFLALVPGSTGGLLLQGSRVFPIGRTPGKEACARIHAWLREKVGRDSLFQTPRLSEHLSGAGGFSAEASGLLAISIPEVEPAYIVWLKPEVIQTVQWAGRPEKLTVMGTSGQALGPRKSFALWTEQVRDSALPFAEEELAEIDLFRRSVIELDLEHQVQAVLRSNAELDQFASVISHDLKEPLRGIQTFAEFLSQDHEQNLPADSRANLDTILGLAKRARLLISELYSFSRLGQMQLALDDVNLNAVVEEIRQDLSLALREQNGKILVPETLPLLRCDRVRVKELLHNLILNGIKYNDSEEKRITVQAQSRAEGITLCVGDNGIGISAENRERVFRIFERLHDPEEYGGGTGIGLAIAKRVVEHHRGRIWIEENGEGTTFCCTLHGKLDSQSAAP